MTELIDNNEIEPGKPIKMAPLIPINELQKMTEDENSRKDNELETKFPGLRDLYNYISEINLPPDEYKRLHFKGATDFNVQAGIARIIPGPKRTGLSWGNSEAGLELIEKAKNEATFMKNSVLHAEMLAIQHALNDSHSKHLEPTDILISTVEPCAMCAAAFYRSGGKNLIYSIRQQDLKGKMMQVGENHKPFKSEPQGYSVKEFLKERDPEIFVAGGYRKGETMERFNLGIKENEDT